MLLIELIRRVLGLGMPLLCVTKRKMNKLQNTVCAFFGYFRLQVAGGV
jgi:hypothetical protein